MAIISSSDDLRLLAEERIAEAQILRDARHFSGAYYLAGYAVELALKAVLTSALASYSMPDQKQVAAAHVHDLRGLAVGCGLQPEADAGIRVAWNVVAPNWAPEDRYRIHSEVRSIQMVDAAREVLEWLRPHW